MDNITKHYKSDFTVPMKLLLDENGIPYPFRIRFCTQNIDFYEASWNGIVGINLLSNPKTDDEEVFIKLDKHGLGIGVLKQETTFSISTEDWKNGVVYKVFAGETGYELTSKKDDIDGEVMTLPISFDMNLIKGDPFLYSDFTEEQITNLQKPAIDAAATANASAGKADTATADAIEATSNANTAADRTNDVADSMLSNMIAMEIRDDMNLYLITPDNYNGVSFSIRNGNLIATT